MNSMDAADLVCDPGVAKTQPYCHTCGGSLQSIAISTEGPAACPECGVFSRLLRAIVGGDLPFFIADAVLPDLKVEDKRDAIVQIVENLAVCGELAEADIDDVAATLIQREAVASTGIGRGIAIPHARHPAVSREVGTLAWCRDGLDFDSIDQEPVYLLVLLLSPIDRHAEHTQALAKIARTLRTIV